MYFRGDSRVSGIKNALLGAISLPYKAISWVNLKCRAFHPKSFPGAFIVSIDNLSFGGTGKTSLVLAIGEFLTEQNIPFAVVLRGYHSKKENETHSTRVDASHTAADVGDEALMFKKRFPDNDVYVGRNRVDSINQAIRAGCKFVLLDDGFQSTHIVKNLKILLMNPQHPYYYLRNFKCMMTEEDMVLYYNPTLSQAHSHSSQSTGGDGLKEQETYHGHYYFQLSRFSDVAGHTVEPRGTKIVAFSALGDNSRFQQDLIHSSHVQLTGYKGFKDHHTYSMDDLEALDQLRRKLDARYLVCTEKDFMKILPLKLHQIPFLYVQNSIKFDFDLMSRLLDHAKKENYV